MLLTGIIIIDKKHNTKNIITFLAHSRGQHSGGQTKRHLARAEPVRPTHRAAPSPRLPSARPKSEKPRRAARHIPGPAAAGEAGPWHDWFIATRQWRKPGPAAGAHQGARGYGRARAGSAAGPTCPSRRLGCGAAKLWPAGRRTRVCAHRASRRRRRRRCLVPAGGA